MMGWQSPVSTSPDKPSGAGLLFVATNIFGVGRFGGSAAVAVDVNDPLLAGRYATATLKVAAVDDGLMPYPNQGGRSKTNKANSVAAGRCLNSILQLGAGRLDGYADVRAGQCAPFSAVIFQLAGHRVADVGVENERASRTSRVVESKGRMAMSQLSDMAIRMLVEKVACQNMCSS